VRWEVSVGEWLHPADTIASKAVNAAIFLIRRVECHPVGTPEPHTAAMEGYFIGSGAILQAGEHSKIIGATLHAQLSGDDTPEVILVDFEAASLNEVRQLLTVASGYSIAAFEAAIASRLMDQGECAFADVVRIIAEATGASDVHLYARWSPPEEITDALQAAGITLHAHPVEAVSRAALIARHRYTAWQGGLKAA